MTLQAEEFIRRFLLHVLPEGFQRIRYYGFLANRYREQKLARCRELLGMPAPGPATSKTSTDYSDRYEELTGSSLWKCPVCHQGRMLDDRDLAAKPTQVSQHRSRIPHDGEDCFGIQIQLCRTSLAQPSEGSSVAKRGHPEKNLRHRSHSPDIIIGHRRTRSAKARTGSSLPGQSDPRPRSSQESIPIGHAPQRLSPTHF